MADRRRTNPLALAVLVCLAERPMHPYEVAQTLRTRAKHESIRLNYGSLYTVVEGLERRGLIRAKETQREGRRPERTVYAITDVGLLEMGDWLAELLGAPVKEYLRFEAALSLLPGLPPDDALSLLQQRARMLAAQVAGLDAKLASLAEQGLPRLFVIEEEYHRSRLAAELDFVRRLCDDIDGGTLSGMDEWRRFYPEGEEDADTIT